MRAQAEGSRAESSRAEGSRGRARGGGSRRSIDMLNGPLPGKILLFAIPLAISSILQQLLNSVDASIAGRFVSSQALAGIGGASPVTAMFVNLFVGLSIGANVVVAMYIGAKELRRIKETVHTAMALACVVGVAVMAIGLLVSQWILDVIGMPKDAEADALVYVRLYFCAMPFLTIYNFASAILRAHGDVRRPLYALAVAVVLNLGLNVLFVCVFGWATAGIGAATVIACAVSAAIVVVFLLREDEPFRLNLREMRFRAAPLKSILRIGVPAGVQSAVFSLSNTVVQAAINSFGSAAIAGSAATLNYEYYTFFFVNAFGQTAVTFTGQNYAAGQVDRCKKIFRWCLLFGFSSSLLLGITFTSLGTTALGLFTTDAMALGYGMTRMWFVELPDCLTSLYEVPAGSMRGMGWSTVPAVITIIGSCVLRIAFVMWVFPQMASFQALMALYPATWMFMIVVMAVVYVLVTRRAYRLAAKRQAPGATAA